MERLDASIFPDPSAPETGVEKPDHVIGLPKSPSLDAALQMHPNLDPSPVKDADHIKFPFLVLEAKSEAKIPGFRAVQTQMFRRKLPSLSKGLLISKRISGERTRN